MEIVKSGSTIQSLQTGIKIIEKIALEGTPLRFVDIQELTGLTKSNLYKYLNTLTQMEILYRDKTTGMYELGSKLIQFGMAAIGQEDVATRIIPYLQEASQKTNCTVLFNVWSNNGPIIARIQNSNQALNIGAQMGSILPPNSSTGKVFKTFLQPSQTSQWISGYELGPESSQMSEKELEEIRTYHIAFAEEPLVPSVSSVSIPVFNYSHELLGTVTVVGFAESIPTSRDDETSRYLIELSKEISKNFGYSTK